MKNTTKLAIWMDHANAHLMNVTADLIETRHIDSEFTHLVKGDALTKSESLMHNKDQHELLKYFKHLGEVIKQYDEVLLFGPTDAKIELFNHLRADHKFENIKIETKNTGKMTENQLQAFARTHFFN